MLKITRNLSFYLLLFLPLYATLAQEKTTSDSTYWTFKNASTLTFSQVSLSNWSGGGENSYSLNAGLNMSYNYAKDKHRWDNALQLSYGFSDQQNTGYRKTDDLINFLSKYGYQAKKRWFYTVSLEFTSQFTDGFDYIDNNSRTLKSTFLAPAYLTVSTGIEYRAEKYFKVFMAPLSNKNTFVMDDILSNAGSFGVDPGEKYRSELGASILASYEREHVLKNVNLLTSLGLFSNYLDKPQNVDIDWKLKLTMKINSYLSANFSTHLIYDDDVKTTKKDGSIGGAKIQFQEIFGVGLQFSL